MEPRVTRGYSINSRGKLRLDAFRKRTLFRARNSGWVAGRSDRWRIALAVFARPHPIRLALYVCDVTASKDAQGLCVDDRRRVRGTRFAVAPLDQEPARLTPIAGAGTHP